LLDQAVTTRRGPRSGRRSCPAPITAEAPPPADVTRAASCSRRPWPTRRPRSLWRHRAGV